MKKKFAILFISSIFILTSLLIARNDKVSKVAEVISPTSLRLSNGNFVIKDLETFDQRFTDKNKRIAAQLNIKEDEAFILGNLAKYWATGLMENRFVYLNDDSDLVYLKFSYKEKFRYSGFCLENGSPCYTEGFEKRLNDIRRTKYMVMDLDSDKVYEVSAPEVKLLKRFLVIKKIHLPRNVQKQKSVGKQIKSASSVFGNGKIKIYLTDSMTKLKPDRSCDSSICSEILNNINNSKESIDMAIYGYSRTPQIETALEMAKKRGVRVRVVYDSDIKGENIYPDTDIIKKLFPDSVSDINSSEANSIMHNKFYIFDNKILITGSANLSHTDMSGFNSNSAVVIESEEVAQIYKREFEQMFRGKFHNDKISSPSKIIDLSGIGVRIYFSPKDKSITNAVIPLINQAKEYIYIPTFVLTDRKVAAALIEAKNRGVEVKIIIDALNASVQHSKHKELRSSGIQVKTENYAGKMHSKSMIIDDKYTITGSMNFSYSGENKNDENLIVIEDKNIAKVYKEFFIYQWGRIDDKWLKLSARAEGKDSVGSCYDGLDNNYDGLTDMEDPACH